MSSATRAITLTIRAIKDTFLSTLIPAFYLYIRYLTLNFKLLYKKILIFQKLRVLKIP